jgi:hypothetical protein
VDGHWWDWLQARWVRSEPADDVEVPVQRAPLDESDDDLHRAAEAVVLQRPVG